MRHRLAGASNRRDVSSERNGGGDVLHRAANAVGRLETVNGDPFERRMSDRLGAGRQVKA